MLKSFCLKALQLIVLTLLLVQMAVGTALAQGIQSPQEASPQSTEIKNKQEEILPARTESTTNERQTKTSNKESVSSSRTSKTDRPVDPYTKYYEGIKKFNQELYGERG